MKKLLNIALLSLLLINCKGNAEPLGIEEKKINVEIGVDSVIKNKKNIKVEENFYVSNYWSFYKISESTITGTSKKTKLEITNKFKNLKVEIDSKTFKIKNLCSYEYYKSDKTPIKYYENTNAVKLYESIFLKNGIKLGKTLSVYQPLYPEKSCEIPWDEFLIIDNTLVVVYDDYLVFFKKENISNSKDCFSNTKITNLPISKEVIDGNKTWNQLDCNIANLSTKDYLRLPDINAVKVFIVGNFNFDDFTYTLVTLKDKKIITKRNIGFAENSENGNNITSITEFEIDKNYEFHQITKIKKGSSFKISKTEKFKIDENGLIVK